MTGQPPNPELQEALLELQQYLSDSVAPLIVADSIRLLMKYPPQVVASTIRAWTSSQYRGGPGSSVPVSDYFFHAIKKIHMMAEFHLVPREALEAYLEQLKQVVLTICPEEDREMLRENLGRLGETSTTVSQAHTIFRQAPTESGPRASASAAAARASGTDAALASAEALQGLRRFSLLLERLEGQGGLGGAVPSGGTSKPLESEALAFAARSSHSSQELELYLNRLKELGLEAGTGNLFRALAQSLPGWVVPRTGETAGALGGVETGALGAMRRIITEADDPAESARRFQEMVQAGIERFNEGSLPQAVAMLELAERLVSEKKVAAGGAEIVRRRLGETLDSEQLKKFAELPEQHALLRKVLVFFTALAPKGLLEELPREPKRDRRRLMLLLLEVHGAPARKAAHEYLSRSLGAVTGEEEWYFRRNLLYLLRRIPRGPDSAPLSEEIDLVLQHAQLGPPLLVVKEAIAALGQLKDEKTELGLMQLMAELEGMLAKPGEAPFEAKDLRILLDRVAATMARLPSARARRALIEHAGKRQAPLGDTMGRLTDLGSQNLSDDPGTVEQLLELLKANLPFRLLGVTLRQNDQNLVHVIEALSGTPLPPVRRALEDVVSRVGGQEAGKVAARVLAGFDKPTSAPGSEAVAAEGPAASLQGDLDLFGLPALLQSLAESSASGTLTLREPKGTDAFATLVLREGKLQECQRGRLRGEEAFYQLLERPSPGQFAFVKGSPPAKPGATPREILPLTLEAMRRYDELQEAASLVPDAMFLEPTSVKPTPHPGEKDGSFLQALWERVSQGGTPRDCEEAVANDSYRIRRVLGHWVEQGSLKARSEQSAPT